MGMTVKRRNHGRNRHGRGHTTMVNCANCGCKPAKDKAIKRYIVRNLVDLSAQRDLQQASAYDPESYRLPKFYLKNYYCVSCAVHSRVNKFFNKTYNYYYYYYYLFSILIRLFVSDRKRCEEIALPHKE